MKAADEKLPPDRWGPYDELKADVSLSEKLGKSVGKVIVLLRALREGGVKDRLLLVVIGLLSIWCLSWSFETGTGLVKDGMVWMDGPRPASIPLKPRLRYAQIPPTPSERSRFKREMSAWKDRWENAPSQDDWVMRRESRNDNLLLNPRERWPHYGLIQEWSGKAGLLLAALWLLAWVLTGKKQNKLTE